MWQPSPEVVNQASSSLIKDTALGAFAIICLALTVWAIRELKKVQDARVEDKEKAADRIEATNEKDRQAQTEQTKAITALASAQTELSRAVDRNTRAIEENSRTIENVIRDALRRSSGASSSQMQAVRPKKEPIG